MTLHPTPTWIPAAFFGIGRKGDKPRLWIVHTMQYPERDTAAEWCARYFAGGSVVASAHRTVDNNSMCEGVRIANRAWATPGLQNPAVQYEFAGYAEQNAADWADGYSEAMLDLGARGMAQQMFDEGLRGPITFIQGERLRDSSVVGVTTHAAINAVFKQSTHWDPGTAFPMTGYLALVNHYLAVAWGDDVGTPPEPVKLPKPKPVVAVPGFTYEETLRIQLILDQLGYYSGWHDGVYGPRTKAAVADYQDDQLFGSLVVDGDWGPATEAHYQWVLTLQRALNGWKGDDIRVDGDYGNVTAARVYDVMERNHGGAYPSWAKLDGVPGPVFCRMLAIPTHPNL